MKINPQLFDKNGLIRLGSGYPTDVKWHPLYAEDEDNNFLAASFSTGEIKLFSLKENGNGNKPEIILERNYVADEPSKCKCVDWSPNGQYLVCGYEDGHLRMFDIFSDKRLAGFDGIGHKNQVNSIRFSPNGCYIVSGSGFANRSQSDKGDNLKFWDAKTGKEVIGFDGGKPYPVSYVNFSPDGHYIIFHMNNGLLKICDSKTGKEVTDMYGSGHTEDIRYNAFAFRPDGRCIVFKFNRHSDLWGAKTNKVIPDIDCSGYKVYCYLSYSFSPDGRYILHDTNLWDTKTGKKVTGFDCSSYSNCFGVFSPDNRYIVFRSSNTNNIELCDAKTGRQIASYDGCGHTRGVHPVHFSPDGHNIISGSKDKNIKLWDAKTGREMIGFGGSGHTDKVSSVAFSPDGRYYIVKDLSDSKNAMKLCDVKMGEGVDIFYGRGHTGPVKFVTFSPDGRYILSASGRETLELKDAKTGKDITGFDGSGYYGYYNSACFHPDGCYIVLASNDSTLKLWDAYTGREMTGFVCSGNAGYVMSVKFSPDGRFIVSGSDHRYPQLWDSRTGSKVSSYEDSATEGSGGCMVSFSPDGRYIASGSMDNTLKLLDVSTCSVISDFGCRGQGDSVNSVSFSPNGRYIVSGSNDNTMLICNLEQILGPAWAKEHSNTPLILTGVWFPDDTLDYLKETKQGNIVNNRPLARCGECGMFFPVEDNILGRELRCSCKRLVKLNEFTAGVER